MAVVTRNVAVLKAGYRGKLVLVKVAVNHAVSHQLMTPQQDQESKQQQGSQQHQDRQQGTQAREGTTTTSIVKTPATAGSVLKCYKSGRK
jgi:hypothetical protein